MNPAPTAPDLLAIFGPTGVGKTAVAIALARRLRARGDDPVAVSADALQVYAGLPILTGAPTAAEQRELEHRLVGTVPLTERFSAGAYAARAHQEIDALRAAGRRPIVVGGTGLYLRAAWPSSTCARRPTRPAAPTGEQPSTATGHTTSTRSSPPATRDAAAAIDPHDRQRLVRAHELLDAGEQPPGGPELWTTHTRHPTRLFGLVMDRQALQRGDRRPRRRHGQSGRSTGGRSGGRQGASDTARKALGFDELLRGDVDAMKRRTRRYAKRQLTWMRKLPDVTLVDVTGREPDDVADELLDTLA